MRRVLVASAVLLVLGSSARAAGMLIPVEKKLPPLALVDHKVTIHIDDQAAVTRIEQTFRNHTNRQLEATYLFPVPNGASVRKFSMWVNGKEETGEIIEADKARKIYTDVVARSHDPGLLEYLKNDLIKLRVFPVPAMGDQKISLTYTSVAKSDNGLVEYVYPMRSAGKAAETLDKFTITVNVKAQHPLTNIYSPSHPITIARPSDKEAVIGFEKNAALLDRDFQLYYQAGSKDIGVTAVTHRPIAGQPGYVMMMLSPRAELSKTQQVPRDFVYVIDTSGSMRGKRLTQAKAALQYCLKNLSPEDRFAMIHFASTVHKYSESLQAASAQNIDAARQWVNGLEATGGTAIDDALKAALALRAGDESRTYTMVFFTDGQPTWGERDPVKIMANVKRNNTGNTRIFSFGVGDDVNTVLLDGLADNTKAISTYVREAEDIEAKVSSLYSKISNPVLANLKLTIGAGVKLDDLYPQQLPDLFHGSQLIVFARYTGKGHTTVTLSGTVGKEKKEFVYELNFAAKTSGGKEFVEDLWARRKVGHLLDQIRVQGETKEVVDEVVTLAKRYGITTPYTSYLMVPDGSAPVARAPGMHFAPQALATPYGSMMMGGGMQMMGGMGGIRTSGIGGNAMIGGGMMGGGMMMGGMGGLASGKAMVGGSANAPLKVETFARNLDENVAKSRLQLETYRLQFEAKMKNAKGIKAQEALVGQGVLMQAQAAFTNKELARVQSGQLGVDFAVQNNALRGQNYTVQTSSRYVQKRNCVDVGGVWIDDGFKAKMEAVTVKAMSEAYFRILERHPEIREVFQLGNYIVWVTPSGKALIIDRGAGVETLPDDAIDRLFIVPATKAAK